MLKKLLAICSLCLFAACTKTPEISIAGKEFKMLNAPENSEITLGFDKTETRFYGAAPVNRYMGFYELKGSNIHFINPASTMMMGPEELMQAEKDYLVFLGNVKNIELKDNKLILNTGNQTAEFEEIGK